MTLLEILVSIALFILLSFSVATSVNSYHAKESFHARLDTITGALSRARTETLTSLNDMQ